MGDVHERGIVIGGGIDERSGVQIDRPDVAGDEIGPAVSDAQRGAVVGDLDKDGTLDLAISAPSDRVLLGGQWIIGIGNVFLYSGANGKSLGVCLPKVITLEFAKGDARSTVV